MHVVSLTERCMHVGMHLMFSVYACMCMCASKNMCIQHVCVVKGVEDGLV